MAALGWDGASTTVLFEQGVSLMPQAYRVVNLTGHALGDESFSLRDGVNFFDELPPDFLEWSETQERVNVEAFCSVKQTYVPVQDAILDRELEEKEDVEFEESDPNDDDQSEGTDSDSSEPTPLESNPPSPEGNGESTSEPEIHPDPEVQKILEMTNDAASELIMDMEDKDFLQKIIDAPTVKAGTKSTAVRRLSFLNAG